MDSRREFIRKTMMLSGAAGMATLPASIQKAFAIDPAPGSTFLDAEHIVLLMQENRSFDHAFGTMRGVRGFNDPRALNLPNSNKVWLQTNKAGETYSPFRLDIKDTKITWMGSLPHSRESQVGARNNGRHDNWIDAKKSSDEDYAYMPLTMGYYTREDIPFYYALADAFTVCDQHFCSSLTPTDPNRLYFWSGTIRAKHDEDARAFIDNGDIEQGVGWGTFPELLEENNISWKIYQNEVSVDNGMTEEENQWLGNYGDNVLEYFDQYNVKYVQSYIDFLPERVKLLQQEIEKSTSVLSGLTPGSDEYKKAEQKIKDSEDALSIVQQDQKKYTAETFNNLSEKEKNIHQKAFTVNSKDPHQHSLEPLNYTDDNTSRKINIPKGDVLHQFRQDVESNKLPTVSWLVAPENFSDHPSAPWFGSWYLSETMDILTKNPDIWKKTIFILTYDENDGYYDHVPPFVAPVHKDESTGKVSESIDTKLEHVKMQQDYPGSIGLGFRVPLVVASPWSRGGFVNSQVFDHTSSLQFLEAFLNKKFGKNIKETNITQWRRTVCGDLTSIFHPYNGQKIEALPFVKKDPFIESIHKAKFKNVPSGYKKLTADEIALINKNPNASQYIPQQEKGTRPACALPYELYANGNFNNENKTFDINLQAGSKIFKKIAAGSPFIIYARNYLNKDFTEKTYAVTAGDNLKDNWLIKDFDNGNYDLEVYGPNGFYRCFKGSENDPLLNVSLNYHTDANGKFNGNIELFLHNNSKTNFAVTIKDNAYNTSTIVKQFAANSQQTIALNLNKSFGWYDFTVNVKGNNNFEKRFAGHVETGKESKSDQAMAGV
ncbi:MAG: phospholipase C, phosphocholine-specific [Parafilimonas sp.]